MMGPQAKWAGILNPQKATISGVIRVGAHRQCTRPSNATSQ